MRPQPTHRSCSSSVQRLTHGLGGPESGVSISLDQSDSE
ncbi:MAG: hypothetical protein JWO25_1311 [Alphaproteobacteria bacterium]|nr:hypothetical protein [Alphaproteobacteria bacterium]